MHELDARHQHQQFAGKMIGAADAGCAVGEARGFGLGRRDQFLQVSVQRGGSHRQHVGAGRAQGDERKIAFHVDAVVRRGERGAGVDDGRGADHQQRVAVGRGVGDNFRAEQGAAAGTVIGHHLLSPQTRQPLCDTARHDVGGTAGGEGHDEAHRALREILRTRR